MGSIHILGAKFGGRNRRQQTLVPRTEEEILSLDPVEGTDEARNLMRPADEKLNPACLVPESFSSPLPDLTNHVSEVVVSGEDDEVRGIGDQGDLLIRRADAEDLWRVMNLVPPISEHLAARIVDVLIGDESQPKPWSRRNGQIIAGRVYADTRLASRDSSWAIAAGMSADLRVG